MSATYPGSASGPADSPLTVPGYIYGVRTWWASEEEGGRVSLLGYGNRAWLPGGRPTEAECLAAGFSSHLGLIAPFGDCTCGLYAVHPWAMEHHVQGPDPLGQDQWIAGIVAAWGTVQVHHEGFRAQFARPVALLLPTESGLRRRELIRRAAKQHRAEVLVVDDAGDVLSYCASHHLGLSRQTVERLLTPPIPETVESSGVAERWARKPPGWCGPFLDALETAAIVVRAGLGLVGIYVLAYVAFAVVVTMLAVIVDALI